MDIGKELLNKTATELKRKLEIKGNHTSPAHTQCNSQAEIFIRTLPKFMKNMVDDSILNWEFYLAPLMFCYIMSYHSTTRSTPLN
jgi:hypothetical protein